MDTAIFRSAQEPIRKFYKNDAKAAFLTLKAKGTADDSTVTCKVETGRGLALAGIHPKAGGSGQELCSGDMLLEALIACAGVSDKTMLAPRWLNMPISLCSMGQKRPRSRNWGSSKISDAFSTIPAGTPTACSVIITSAGVRLAACETILTECSHKFSVDEVDAMARRAGFKVEAGGASASGGPSVPSLVAASPR